MLRMLRTKQLNQLNETYDNLIVEICIFIYLLQEFLLNFFDIFRNGPLLAPIVKEINTLLNLNANYEDS